MTKRQFVASRIKAWRRFAAMVDELGPSLRKHPAHYIAFEGGERELLTELVAANQALTSDELAEFSRLFRGVCYDLAIIRSRDWGQGLVDYLNNLVSRGHNAFYSAPPGNLSYIVRFLAVDFPQRFRRNAGYFFAAAALFFVPFFITAAVVQYVPGAVDVIIPRQEQEAIGKMYESESGKDPWANQSDAGFGNERSLMFGFYVKNNTGIAFRVFVLGVLLGIPTVYELIREGIVIGAVFGHILSLGPGHSQKLLSFVISHGSFELTAIAIAGGAGLMLGDALLHPGRRSRWESLKVQGFEAIQIALGAGVMLGIAAMIEAFWSPAPIPAALKYSVGAALWLLVFAYLGLSGLDFGAKNLSPLSPAQAESGRAQALR